MLSYLVAKNAAHMMQCGFLRTNAGFKSKRLEDRFGTVCMISKWVELPMYEWPTNHELSRPQHISHY
jgi:hypothetical protein